METSQIAATSKPRKRRFLKMFSILVILLILLTAGAILGLHLNRDKIREVIVEEINHYLLIPVDVGDIQLGFWRHFPYLSVDFRQVETREPTKIPGQPRLLKADHIYLKMHSFDLLRKQYRIRRILIQDAELNLLLFADGSDNYHVLKSRDGDTAASLEVQLDMVGLRGVDFRFRDLPTDQDYRLFLERIDLKGRLSQDHFDAVLGGRLAVKTIRTGAYLLVENRTVDVTTTLGLDTGTGRLLLRSGKIKTPSMTLLVEGMIKPGEVSDSLDLRLQSSAASINGLLELLPEETRSLLTERKVAGNLSYVLHIKGLMGGGQFPSIKAEWQLDNGALLYCPKQRVWIKNLRASGRYDNQLSPAPEKHLLDISSLNFTLGGHAVKASLKLSNLAGPRVDGQVQASLDMEKLLSCAMESATWKLRGMTDLEGSFRFKLEEGWRLASNWAETMVVDAKGALRSGSFEYPDAGLNFQTLSGSVRIKDDVLHVLDVEARAPEGPVRIDARFSGFLSWLTNKQHKAYAELSLYATELPLETWFAEEAGKTTAGFDIGNIEADISVHIDKVVFRGFKASGLSGDVQYSSRGLVARRLSLETMGGSLVMQGSLVPVGEGQRAVCQASLMNINITELFRQLNNFGQSEITYKHLSGILTAEVELSMLLDKSYYPLESSIKALANTKITDGIIQDYEPLKDLARFIRVGKLDRVHVAPLENQILVRDSRIIIPEMRINTDAINISLSGTHYFDQRIDYNFQVLLSEVLGRKARESKKENAEFGIVEDDGLGRTTLFLRMTGTSDKPVFSYDRRGVMQKVGKNLEAERKEMRQVIKEEFHWLRPDTLKREQRRVEKRKIKEQEKGEFLFDWDEE